MIKRKPTLKKSALAGTFGKWPGERSIDHINSLIRFQTFAEANETSYRGFKVEKIGKCSKKSLSIYHSAKKVCQKFLERPESSAKWLEVDGHVSPIGRWLALIIDSFSTRDRVILQAGSLTSSSGSSLKSAGREGREVRNFNRLTSRPSPSLFIIPEIAPGVRPCHQS